MSAETLRKAANLMRETHRHDSTREADTFVAVAYLLEQISENDFQDLGAFETCTSVGSEALLVARTYLGELA